MQPARDHQVQHQPETVVEFQADAFADSYQRPHRPPFDAFNRWIYGSQKKRIAQPHLLKLLADDARLQRAQIRGNVRKLRHAIR